MSEIAHITAMREERYKAAERMKEIVRDADTETRSLTAEEAQEFDRLEERVDALEGDIARREKAAALQPRPKLLEQIGDELREFDGERREHEQRGDAKNSKEYRSAFEKYLRGGVLDTAERRDLSVGTTTAGGYSVPTSMANQIVEYAVMAGTVRARATVIVTGGGEPLNVPRLTAFGTSGWQTEGAAYTESDPTFGTMQLSAYKATHIAQVSEELLQDSQFDIAGLLTRVLGRNLGLLENTAFVVGSGSSQPTGICTSATTVGKTGTTGQTTSVTADDLVDVEFCDPAVVPRERVVDDEGRDARRDPQAPHRRLGRPDLPLAGRPRRGLARPAAQLPGLLRPGRPDDGRQRVLDRVRRPLGLLDPRRRVARHPAPERALRGHRPGRLPRLGARRRQARRRPGDQDVPQQRDVIAQEPRSPEAASGAPPCPKEPTS